MRPPSVSVTCPTYGRPDYHQHLYTQFDQQSYPFKDLWVLDDSPAPSQFFAALRDPRIHYQWTPIRSSIGAKRNALIDQARGDVIAQFDDDDEYRVGYLATMVGRMRASALTKLSVWDLRSAYDGSMWRWDTRKAGPINFAVSGSAPASRMPVIESTPEALDAQLHGYGFSYVFDREAWQMCPFGDISLGEDLDFINRVRRLYPVSLQADIPDIVVHAMHAASTSRAYPQECIGFCRTCVEAPASMTPDYGADTTGAATDEVPSKISLVPGRTYNAVALVKASHPIPSLIARALGYGLSVISFTDNIQPPGMPPPKSGYRYIAVRAQARTRRDVGSRIPWPFSAADASRVVALSTS